MRRSPRGGGLLALLLCAAAPAALAGVLDLAPFAAATLEHDDNVYRFADAAEARAQHGDARLGDTSLRLAAGTAARYEIGAQRLAGSARIDAFRYRTFDELDRTEHDVGSQWLFRVNPMSSGHLRFRDTRQLQSLTGRDGGAIGFVKQRRVDALSTVALTPDWSVQATAAGGRRRYTEPSSQDGDLDERRAGVGAEYAGEPIGRVLVTLELTDGEFPQRTPAPGAALAAEFVQYDAQVKTTYAPGGVSTLRVEAGYTRRSNGTSSARDFSGITGRLEYERRSGRTRLNAEGFRRLRNVDEPDANYAEQVGAQLTAKVELSPVMHAQLRARAWHDEYESLPTAGGPAREDDVVTAELGLVHEVRRWLIVNTGARHESRDSTRASRAYDATVLSLGVEVRYD